MVVKIYSFKDSLRSHGKDEVVGVYIYMMNTEDHNRSQTHAYQTVQVVYQHDLADLGYNRCFNKLVSDLNKMISNGFCLPNGTVIPVRLVMYKADNLEKNLVYGMQKSFSNARYFSSVCYIQSEDRKFAMIVSDLEPSKFCMRDKKNYELDVQALEEGDDSRGLQFDSVINSVQYFHCTELGWISQCMKHDIHAGFARVDVSWVVKAMGKAGVINLDYLAAKNETFRKILSQNDRRNWMPKFNASAFTKQLPGSSTQNATFLQYLPLLVFDELKDHPFLSSPF